MTNCKGCDARDELIQSLAKEIDRLNDIETGDILELPTTPELVEYVRQIGLEMKG